MLNKSINKMPCENYLLKDYHLKSGITIWFLALKRKKLLLSLIWRGWRMTRSTAPSPFFEGRGEKRLPTGRQSAQSQQRY